MIRQLHTDRRSRASLRIMVLGGMIAFANLTSSLDRAHSEDHPPAATLGQPRPAASLSGTVRPVVRASQADLSESSSETSTTDRLDPDPWNKNLIIPKATEYPPTYSSTKRDLMPKAIGELWKKNGTETKFTPAIGTDAKHTYRDRRVATAATGPEKEKKTETLPAPKLAPETKPVVVQPVIIRTNSGVPAWRWYGYGTITPGVNTPNGDGTYPLASVSWLQESRATPGAIPQSFATAKATVGLKDAPPNYLRGIRVDAPLRDNEEPVTVFVPQDELPRIEPAPTEPIPRRGIPLEPVPVEPVAPVIESKKEEPQDDFVLPAPLPPTGVPLTSRDPLGGTTIYFPVPAAPPKASFNGTIKPKTLPPTSMRPGPIDPLLQRATDTRILVRGQAPEATPEKIVNSISLAPKIERAARGAKEVHLQMGKSNRIAIRLIVPRGVDFEAIADRIGAIPELSKFYLDFDVTVR